MCCVAWAVFVEERLRSYADRSRHGTGLDGTTGQKGACPTMEARPLQEVCGFGLLYDAFLLEVLLGDVLRVLLLEVHGAVQGAHLVRGEA